MICVQCGVEFTTSNPRQKCCTDKCSAERKRILMALRFQEKKRERAANAKPKTQFCVVCQHEFTPKPKASKQKACSLECSRIEKLRRMKEYNKTTRVYVSYGDVAPDPPPKPGLPCGMSPEDEAIANAELRALSSRQAKADHYMRRLIEAVEMGASA